MSNPKLKLKTSAPLVCTCAACQKEIPFKDAIFWTDETNIAITNSAPPYCRDCFYKAHSITHYQLRKLGDIASNGLETDDKHVFTGRSIRECVVYALEKELNVYDYFTQPIVKGQGVIEERKLVSEWLIFAVKQV